jgi:putative ATP-binding cassette transporter
MSSIAAPIPPLPAGRPGLRAFFAEFWRLAAPYWKSEERATAWLLLGVVVALNLGSVYLSVLFNHWYHDFYNTIQNLDQQGFYEQLGRFALLATAFIVVAVYQMYFNLMLQMRWRRWLTARYLSGWLGGRTYYRLELTDRGTDNPDQRISEDLRLLCEQTLDLGLGLMNAVVTLASFVVILWMLSGPLSFVIAGIGITIPGYMVWAAIGYAVIGTWLANAIGRPLIGLNFNQQRYEADFRYSLVRLRENSEGVALYRGEAREQDQFEARFGHVLTNWWRIIRKQKQLTWFTAGYNQIAIIFPFVVAAPRFFAKEISLGGLMQIVSAFGQVHTALSYLINSYTLIANWKATVDRLTGFEAQMRRVAELRDARDHYTRAESASGRLSTAALRVELPDGRALVDGLDLELGRRDAVLVSGPSGCGKSTLLRALAGIWPFGGGRIEMPPASELLFLSQRPYLPLGTLREAICYPLPPLPDGPDFDEVIDACGLAHLRGRLDDTEHWSQVLSGGEQQRVAIARALLVKPAFLFLDEATASLDEPSEAALYDLLGSRLPDTTLVSVGHRPALRRWHRQRLSPGDSGRWTLETLEPQIS